MCCSRRRARLRWPVTPPSPLQPDAKLARVLAAYGGGLTIGSLLWGMAFHGFRPDRYHLAGAIVCLVGVGVIMYAPR